MRLLPHLEVKVELSQSGLGFLPEPSHVSDPVCGIPEQDLMAGLRVVSG